MSDSKHSITVPSDEELRDPGFRRVELASSRGSAASLETFPPAVFADCGDAQMKMQMTDQGILPPSLTTIRGEAFVRSHAAYMRDRPGFAADKVCWALDTIAEEVERGGKVLTPRRVELEMAPGLWRVDGFVHASNRKPVFDGLPYFRLLDPPMSFKEDAKRTMNHFIARADAEIAQALDLRSLSMVFWIGVARTIDEHRQG